MSKTCILCGEGIAVGSVCPSCLEKPPSSIPSTSVVRCSGADKCGSDFKRGYEAQREVIAKCKAVLLALKPFLDEDREGCVSAAYGEALDGYYDLLKAIEGEK